MLCFSQSWTQSLALSLNSARSTALHFCFRRGHLRRWSIVCGSEPHSQVVSSLFWYPHFLSVTLQRPEPDLSRLRHFHWAQLESAPGGSSSLALIDIDSAAGRSSSLSCLPFGLSLCRCIIWFNYSEEALPGFEPALCWFMAEKRMSLICSLALPFSAACCTSSNLWWRYSWKDIYAVCWGCSKTSSD